MLYLTTRDSFDTFTASRAMSCDFADNGGLYLPFKLPKIDPTELKGMTFGQCCAQVLNQFFSQRMTGREVEFVLGRNPVRVHSMTDRVVIAENWRGTEPSYGALERKLAQRLCKDGEISSWMRIAIRIAVVFGTFAELLKNEIVREDFPVDVALPEDFNLTMAVWYAREMGLPIGTIILSARPDSPVWDLLHLGQVRLSINKNTREAERLIHAALGVEEAKKYALALESGSAYTLLPEAAMKLRQGMFCAVVSRERENQTVSQVYRTTSALLVPQTASAYSALMDYRAKSGESRRALLLADDAPLDHADVIVRATGLSETDIQSISAI